MTLAIIALTAASIIGSGVLFKHQRWFTYVALVLTLVEAQWLLLALISRDYYTAGSLVLLAFWLVFIRHWKIPAWNSKFGLAKEVAVAAVLAVVLFATYLILSANGFHNGDWVMHGFYNGDTTTLVSLVENARLTPGLSQTNPFAAGESLEYPTLLHIGIADLLPDNWLEQLPLLMYLQLLATVPLFFLLWDLVYAEPAEKWKRWFGVNSRMLVIAVQAALVFYVMALSWDAFVYPQSHFFLTGLFLAQVAILISAQNAKGKDQLLPVSAGTALALVLMFANAVTGTAAVAAVCVFYLLRAYNKGRSKLERGVFLAGIPLFAVLFFAFTPGNGSFGIIPGFSYTAAIDMLRLAPIALAMVLAIFWYLGKYPFLNWAAGSMFALAFFTYIFSTRDIVVANASRFFYHGILFGFPLLMFPLLSATGWIKRELLYTQHKVTEYLIGWILVGSSVAFFLLPALASGASTHDNLMLKNRQVVTAEEQEALSWISENTVADDVFVMQPDFPWTVPFFTGRSLLRTNYWLSVEDDKTAAVNAAFAGDTAAQQQFADHADYLYLRAAEKSSWETESLSKVFGNDRVEIFELGS